MERLSNMEKTPTFDVILGVGDKARNIGEYIASYGGVITQIGRDFPNLWSTSFGSNLSGNGQAYQTTKYGSRTYPIGFTAFIPAKKVSTFRDTILGMCDCPDGPEKLFVATEPNSYYMVVPSGSFTLTETLKGGKVEGKVEFIIVDGLKHSSVTKVLNKTSNPDLFTLDSTNKAVKISINNEGTAPIFPTVHLKSKSNNGYFGIAHPTGMMGLGFVGSSEEGSNEFIGGTESQQLINIKYGDSSDTTGWGQFKPAQDLVVEAPFVPTVGIGNDGRIGYYESNQPWKHAGLKYLQRSENVINYKWMGAASYIDIPADESGYKGAADFRCDFNLKFWENVTGQTGAFSIVFADKDNKPICTYDVAKDSTTSGASSAKFWIGYNNQVKSISFGANNNEPGMPDPNIAFNQNAGACYVMKENTKITFGYAGQPYSFNEPTVGGREVKRIYVQFHHLQAETKGYIHLVVLESLQFQKLNAKRYDMTPNKYQAGSVLTVDNEYGKVYFSPDGLNKGSLAQSELKNHDEFFSLPKGKSTIEIISSDWVTELPDVEVEFREAWL